MKKSLIFALLGVMAVPLWADVNVSWYKITFTGAVSEKDVRQGISQYRKRFFPLDRLCVVAKEVDAEALALLVRSYSDAPRFEVQNCLWLTDLSPLASLRALKELTVRHAMLPEIQRRVKTLDVSGLDAFPSLEKLALQGMPVPDLTAVGRCSELKSLDFRYLTLTDLTPLSDLVHVKEISVHGTTLPDFAPLANLPALESIDFSSAKVPDDKWSSLGALRQVKTFTGGSTKMTSLAWVKDVPRLESLTLFSEEIRDYSPISGALNLKTFKAMSMRSFVDASFARGCPALEVVALSSSRVLHPEALGAASSVRVLDLSEVKNGCNLSFVSSLANLETLTLDRTRIQNFDAVKGLPRLRQLSIRSLAPGSSISLKGLEACSGLESLTISRGAFSKFEIDDVAHACQKNVTRFKIIQK